MLGRFGEVVMEYPGGCVIGERPIDLHLQALEKMGVAFSEEDGKLKGAAKKLHGADIRLEMPSVGATENILLAAVLAEGVTVLSGAAREPEVEALCRYLAASGAEIEGIGSPVLRIKGGSRLHGAEFNVPADRIVAGTYLFACVGTGGSVLLKNAPCRQLQAVLQAAESMGARCHSGNSEKTSVFDEGFDGNWLYVQGPQRPEAVCGLRTAVYPGFPTDLQSMALAVLTRAVGESRIEETIFENRFRVVEPLRRMGADIELLSRNAVRVRGVEQLFGASLEAQELRGGAALVLAALMAEGESEITGGAYIERGYENIGKDLRDLGARIVSV
jgi:UDP-N-acetylglucosamine 1-carboxyvinyltransferase